MPEPWPNYSTGSQASQEARSSRVPEYSFSSSRTMSSAVDTPIPFPAEVVRVHRQGRAIGVFVCALGHKGLAQECGCDEPGARLRDVLADVQADEYVSAVLLHSDLGDTSGDRACIGFAEMGPRAVAVHVPSRLERVLPRIVDPQAVAGETPGIPAGCGSGAALTEHEVVVEPAVPSFATCSSSWNWPRAGCTPNPDEEWMLQVARNLTDAEGGFLRGKKYLLMDRDRKFSAAFQATSRRDAYTQPADLPQMCCR